MYDADRPIQKSNEDRLNRALFAKYLARCMLDHEAVDSLVIGLYGASGVGKTSLLNLTIEELNFAASNMLDQEKPIILSFSAWSYSGQHQLIYSFFRRLSSALQQADYLENAEEMVFLLELYVSFFTHRPPTSTSVNAWFKTSAENKDKAYGWAFGRDLTQVKAELNELLKNKKQKIIIIIDNISRLYDYEIKQIFQIVKSMGDFNNTIYLLSFDKAQVIHAINKIDGYGGEDLIQKVVQLSFDIPPILQSDLENLLAARLNHVVATVPLEAWDSEYWADLYYGALKFLFKNCRDITRYINTLSFSYARVREVVNPVDFFALTAIEVFVPQLYTGIRDNKDLFTDLLDNVYVLNKEQLQEDKSRCEEILARTHGIPHSKLIELLIKMFPRIRHIYQPETVFFHSESTARKLKKLCSPDLFDAYFRLSMQNGDLPATEFKTILNLSSDPLGFDQALARLNQDDRVLKFLDQLDMPVLNTIPAKNARAIINALLDNGDLFPPGISGPLSLETSLRIHRIIHHLLHHFKQSDERFSILQNAIANASKSVFILVCELREQAREHHENSDTFVPLEYRDLNPSQLESLQKFVTTKIANWADTKRLADHPKLLELLFAWLQWGNTQDCQNYVKQLTDTDKGLVNFLVATMKKAVDQAMTKYEKDPEWEKCLLDVEAFIPPHELEKHARLIFEDPYFEKLRETEQLSIMIFLDLIKAKTKKVIPNTTA